MKIALAGVGHIHIGDVVEELKKAELEEGYVFDPDPIKARAVAKALRWTPVDELKTLCNVKVDGIIVASETGQHGSIVPDLAATGSALFVEKPLAATALEATELASHFREGQAFHTGYFLRDYSAIAAIKKRIDQGNFGDIKSIHISCSHDGLKKGWFGPGSGFEWLTNRDRAGFGGFGDLGLHAVDLLTWLSGQKPVEIEAEIGSLPDFPTDVPDHFGIAKMRADLGAQLSFYAGWATDPKFQGKASTTGSHLSVEILGAKGKAFFTRDQAWFKDCRGKQEELDARFLGAGAAVATFLRSLRENDRKLTTGLKKPVEDIILMNDLYKAAEVCQMIQLPRQSYSHNRTTSDLEPS